MPHPCLAPGRRPALLGGLLAALLLCGLRPTRAALAIRSAPLPAFTPCAERTIDTVLVHYISAINVVSDEWASPARVLAILRDYRLSAHYLIDRAGQVTRLVAEQDIAWHAGGSQMPAPDGRRNVNRFSIGVELVATASSGFTDAQYAALAALLRDIRTRHPIRHVLGHADVAGPRAVRLGLRREAKVDPGPLFDWTRLEGTP